MSTGNSAPTPAQPSRVSRWLGVAGEELTLSGAIDALSAAARAAGVPSWLWFAGLFYPALDLLPGGLGNIAINHSRLDEYTLVWNSQLGVSLILMLFFFPIRLIVGLAAISAPQSWSTLAHGRRAPRLRDAWKAGRGITLSGMALTLQMILMACIGIALLLAPPFYFMKGLELPLGLLIPLMAPFVGVFLVFMALVSVIYQVSLSSLGQNRRGASSALVHGWRIARHRPWATMRAALVDLVLWLTQLALLAAAFVALLASCIGSPLIPFAWLALLGFVGVTRACYWARMYRALGGLAPEDGVPGLGEVTPPPLPRAG